MKVQRMCVRKIAQKALLLWSGSWCVRKVICEGREHEALCSSEESCSHKCAQKREVAQDHSDPWRYAISDQDR